MVYRTVICVVLVGVVGVGLACGQVTTGGVSDEALRDPAVGLESEASIAPGVGVSDAGLAPSASTPGPEVSEQVTTPTDDEAVTAQDATTASNSSGASVQALSGARVGPSTLEERILKADVIVRARLTSKSPSSRSGRLNGDVQDRYIPWMDFTFEVLEVLKGTAGTSAVVELAVYYYQSGPTWERPSFQTAVSAEANSMEWVNEIYDSQWESNEAILFLWTLDKETSSFQTGRPSTVQYVFVGHQFFPAANISSDVFSIASEKNKVWLPATGASGSEFYLDNPAESESPTTTTLTALKSTITTTENMVDSSIPGHRECLVMKGWRERLVTETTTFPHELDIPSAQAEGTVVMRHPLGGGNEYHRYLLSGPDSDKFSTEIEDDDTDPLSYSNVVKQTGRLPMGQYTLYAHVQADSMKPCGYVPPDMFVWTINAVPPEGIIHELLFDPVTVGSTVAADGTNGVLKPAAFTDASGGSVTIHSISYEAGTVEVGVTPDAALAGQIVDFIELDGTMSLSLDVADATVDPSTGSGQAGKLNWSVSSQPWEDGDMLMVRIREAR